MPLKKLGPYNLSDVLGRGGMGTVYRAQHEDTLEICAVKALAPTFAEDDHFRSRFESEIEALLKLDHPNIVGLISYGQEDGNLYFAMDLVEGESLFRIQRDGHHFDWREVLKIANDIAAGLRHAHDRGIIHRDLKPGNLLKAKSGATKITDFGIAKSFGTSQNTGTNVLGTMDFMSPEQAKGEPVTVRSDLYSLGTVMYTLLAGKPPFNSTSVEESVRNLTKVPPPSITKLVPEVPQEIETLIRKLLAKNPEDRIQTAQALIHQIDEIEHQLRNQAEAQTAKHSVAGDTFDLAMQNRGDAVTERIEKKTEPSTRVNIRQKQTTAESDASPDDKKRAGKPDYFSTAEQAKRRKQSESSEPRQEGLHTRGFWILAVSLVVVLALAIYGLIVAFTPPNADSLYTKIQDSRQHPEEIRDELKLFLKHHPDDPRGEEVQQLQNVADAIALYNRLSIRANMVSIKPRLSEIENQYVKIISGLNESPSHTHTQLKAFLTLYGEMEDVSESDAECIVAAQSYIDKIAKDARSEIDFHRERILRRLEDIANQPSSSKEEIYQSIIELYDGIDWAKDLVEDAKRALEKK